MWLSVGKSCAGVTMRRVCDSARVHISPCLPLIQAGIGKLVSGLLDRELTLTPLNRLSEGNTPYCGEIRFLPSGEAFIRIVGRMATNNSISINLIPREILGRFHAKQIVLVTREDQGAKVLGTTSLDPGTLQEIGGLRSFSELRQQEGVYSITLTCIQLNPVFCEEATEGFENRFQLLAELDSLCKHYDDEVYLAYAVTHFNSKPLDEMTVFVGGDCYRTGPEVRDLYCALSRTKDLAQAMIRKAVMIFPDIPTLHGGKKGEWIVVNKEGEKIDGISTDAIVALGTLIIPKGIQFLNRLKEKEAVKKEIFVDHFPEKNVIRPDTASPDVLSGPNWSAMCHAWKRRNIDLSFVTCLPKELGGPIIPSSFPTAYGVVATAAKLIEHYYKCTDISKIKFLLEALGGVGQTTVKALIEKGARPENITAFDRSTEACLRTADKYGIQTAAMTHDEYYRRLPAHGPECVQYHIWINNGEGGNTRPEHVESLLRAGVRIFCGAANNLFQVSTEQTSRKLIFEQGGWAWPDPAASAGGWTLAVIDLATRAQHRLANTLETQQRILQTICNRNERLVEDVVSRLNLNGRPSGQAVWDAVETIINQRVESTLNRAYEPGEIAKEICVTNWIAL